MMLRTGMQWLWVAVFALCAARLCGAAEPGSGFQVVPMWAHVHQKLNGDDGTEAAASIVQWLKDEHYKGILFTPHANNISFEEYRSIVDPLNTGDFLVLAGRELNVAREVKEDGKILCHVNALSDVAAPAVMDASPWAEDLPGLMAELDREGALYIWNHPWSCPAWSANPELFKGIEFFNDFGPGYIDGVTYEVARTAYLDALRAGARPFVVSGIDMHMMSQTVTGEFITYAFPDTFTRESLLAAMHSGHLVAAFNARLLALNQRPGIRTRTTPDGDLHISGTAATRFYNGYKPELIIYKNGDDFEPAEPAVFTRRDKKSKGYSVYDFSFTVSADPGAKTCFSFEIPHYIMSSPYCLAATPAN